MIPVVALALLLVVSRCFCQAQEDLSTEAPDFEGNEKCTELGFFYRPHSSVQGLFMQFKPIPIPVKTNGTITDVGTRNDDETGLDHIWRCSSSSACSCGNCGCEGVVTESGQVQILISNSFLREKIRTICRSELLKNPEEITNFIQTAIQNDRNTHGTCLKELGWTARYDEVSKSCRKCPSYGCGSDISCAAACSARIKILNVQQEMEQLSHTYHVTMSQQQETISQMSSKFHEQEEITLTDGNIAKAALALACLSNVILVLLLPLGWYKYNQLLIRTEGGTGILSQPRDDVRHDTARQPGQEQNGLLNQAT